jgi:hypothetical protein
LKHQGTKLALATLALLAAVALGFVRTRRIPKFTAPAIPKGASNLTTSDVEKLLTSNYEVVRHVRQVPTAVRQSFTNYTGLPFDMNDPGDPISTDAIMADASSRQLLLAAIGSDSAILVYEQGGFVSERNIVVFSYRNGGKGWAAAIGGYTPRNMASLQNAIREKKFRVWERSK